MPDETQKSSAAEPAPAAPPEEPKISIEEFGKVQMRVGQILEAERIPGSKRLLKLKVDLGGETRQVVAGIAESYEAASIVNRKIVLVANIKPAKVMGVESNGMVVAASLEGKAVLATFAEDVPNGTLLK